MISPSTSPPNLMLVDPAGIFAPEQLAFLTEAGFGIQPVPSDNPSLANIKDLRPDLIMLRAASDVAGVEQIRLLRQQGLPAELPICLLADSIDIFEQLQDAPLLDVEIIVFDPDYPAELLFRLRQLLERGKNEGKWWALKNHEEQAAGGELALDVKRPPAVDLALQSWAYVFEHVSWAVAIGSIDGRIELVNTAYAEMHGYTVDELIGRPIATVYAPSYREILPHYIKRTHTQGHHGFESTHRRKDGTTFPVWVEATAVKDEQGRPLYRAISVHDLTPRKQIENALRQSEERLRDFMDQAPLFFGILDENLTFLDFNEAAWQSWPHIKSRDELLGQRLPDLLPDFSSLERRHAYKKVMATGDPLFLHDVIIPGFDNLHLNIHAFRTSDGLGVILQDIGEQIRSERARLESDQQLQAIFDHTLGAILLADTKTNFVKVNPAACELFGYSEEQLLNMNIADVIQEKYLPEFRQKWRIWMREGYHAGEVAIINGQGQKLVAAYRAVSNIIEGLHLVALDDITERIRTEASLRESRDFAEKLIASMLDGISVIDSHGVHIIVNEALCQMVGFEAEELIGVGPPYPYWPPEEYEHIQRAFGLTLQGVAEDFELVFMRKNGERFPVIISPSEIRSDDGEVLSYIATVKNITERKELEEQIRQSDRLAAVGQLATGIAHDFNNIMSGIVLYTELAANMNDVPARAQQRLQIVLQQAGRATDLIQQLLDFGRRSSLERKPINVLLPLQELFELLGRMLREDIILRTVINSDEYMVLADPTRLQQIFMNLAVNARDAMPNGGELSFEVQRIYVADTLPGFPDLPAGAWVRLSVADTGLGIAPDVIPHIFEPFFSTKEPGQGTGLGLAQVYGIVKQHDGFISVKSGVGQGATFHVFLPALEVPAVLEETPRLDAEVIMGEGETILVVEDNAHARAAIVHSLELLSYKVLTAADGQEALTVLDSQTDNIDLIVSDMVMPVMGGAELLQEIKARGLTVPVVMLSGYFLEDQLETLRSLGMTGWLSKPPRLGALSQMVRQALSDR